MVGDCLFGQVRARTSRGCRHSRDNRIRSTNVSIGWRGRPNFSDADVKSVRPFLNAIAYELRRSALRESGCCSHKDLVQCIEKRMIEGGAGAEIFGRGFIDAVTRWKSTKLRTPHLSWLTNRRADTGAPHGFEQIDLASQVFRQAIVDANPMGILTTREMARLASGIRRMHKTFAVASGLREARRKKRRKSRSS